VTQTENKPKKSNNFFLISFLPAILYWYLESQYPVKTALIGGIALSVAEILFEKFYSGHVHQLSKFNFFLIIALGGFSLMEENGIWFKLQPSLSPDAAHPPDFIMKSMERNMVIMFVCYGILMGVLAVWFPTSVWAFFKTAGLFVVMGIFMVVQMVLNKRAIQKARNQVAPE
jgi:intracellular septation protein